MSDKIEEYAAIRVQRAEMQWGRSARPDLLRGDDRTRFDKLSEDAAALWKGFSTSEKHDAAELYFTETKRASDAFGRK